MKMNLAALAVLGAVAAPVSAYAAAYPILEVPNAGFAQLNLPQPFAKIVFPPGTELDGKVVSLDGGRTVLIKFAPHSIKKLIIGYILLADGTTLRIGFRQVKGATPPVWDAPGVSDTIPQRTTEPAVGWIVHKMRSTVITGSPDGMSSTDLPAGGYLGPIKVTPLAAWAGGGYELLEYKLTSKTLVSVEPRNFYRKGVVAVLTQADTVSAAQSPVVLIMERTPNE